MSDIKPDAYRGKPLNSRQGRPFEPWNHRGYISLQVLPELNGRTWDDIALGYVHALRPSQLRVVQGGIQLDAQRWRVTVYLKDYGVTIECIDQEVEVGLPSGCPHGAGLEAALAHGLESKQVAWHNQPGIECYDATASGKKHYKLLPDGTQLPYPK